MRSFYGIKLPFLYKRRSRILSQDTQKPGVSQKNQKIHIKRGEVDNSNVDYIPRPFITTWRTVWNNEEINIPTNSGSSYNYTVDWGDGSSDTHLAGDATHRYASPGTYRVTITGDFSHIYFDWGPGANKIRTVEQWGDIRWASMERAFAGCKNLKINATDAPDLSK